MLFRQNEECAAISDGEHLALHGETLLDGSQLEGGEEKK